MITLTFDGGAAPNPGKGYGSYRAVSNTNPPFEVSGSRIQFGEHLTNNQAEYMALRAGLERVVRTLSNGFYGDQFPKASECRLLIYGDSRLVIKQVAGKYKIKVPHLKELREQVMGYLACFKSWQAHWHGRSKSVSLFGH